MVTYATYQSHPGRAPELTPVRLYVKGSRRVDGTLEVALRQGPEGLSFRVNRTARLNPGSDASFKAEMQAVKDEELKDRPVVCEVDKKTGAIYSLTPDFVAL